MQKKQHLQTRKADRKKPEALLISGLNVHNSLFPSAKITR